MFTSLHKEQDTLNLSACCCFSSSVSFSGAHLRIPLCVHSEWHELECWLCGSMIDNRIPLGMYSLKSYFGRNKNRIVLRGRKSLLCWPGTKFVSTSLRKCWVQKKQKTSTHSLELSKPASLHLPVSVPHSPNNTWGLPVTQQWSPLRSSPIGKGFTVFISALHSLKEGPYLVHNNRIPVFQISLLFFSCS